jgi:hypothetical protein
VTFYPDAEVVKVTPLTVAPVTTAPADIEQEARAEAGKSYPRGTATQQAEWRAGFAQGYIAGASRPAVPAPIEVTDEMVERAAGALYEQEPRAMGPRDWSTAGRLTKLIFCARARAALLAAFDIREQATDRENRRHDDA